MGAKLLVNMDKRKASCRRAALLTRRKIGVQGRKFVPVYLGQRGITFIRPIKISSRVQGERIQISER